MGGARLLDVEMRLVTLGRAVMLEGVEGKKSRTQRHVSLSGERLDYSSQSVRHEAA